MILKKQPTKNVPEGSPDVGISRQRLLLAIIAMFKTIKETMSKELKESLTMVSH